MMMTINNKLHYTDAEIREYLGNPSERQMYKLRGRYGLPFILEEGVRMYSIEAVNKWILGPSAHLYPVHELIHSCNPEKASEITGKSWYSLAHDRSRGKGLPYYYVGQLVRYVESDLDEYVFKNSSAGKNS